MQIISILLYIAKCKSAVFRCVS